MKILVFAHRLEVGGTQQNAIELTAALRDLHGHEVVLFATPGPMVKLAEQKGLRFLPAPDARFHPSSARMRALRDAVRRERPDLLHVWDWWQCVDAYYAVHLLMRVPMVVTDMMMNLTRLLPKALPTTFGTPALVDQAKATGRRRVELILPPVDIHLNAPGAVDPGPFRQRYGIVDSDITLVTVSRLEEWMKRESLFRTVDVVRALGRDLPLRLVIVGDGTARTKLEQLAGEINAELGRPAVVLTGALLDPRPAYAAADIVVGMGGSALRGMAFGKPVVIVGEQGFSAPLTPETAESFYYEGIYGRGDGSPGNARHVTDIRGLAEHPELLPVLGQFSRQFVLRHFSLETVSTRLAQFCRRAAAEMPPLHVAAADGLRTAAVYLRERRFLTPSRGPDVRGTPVQDTEGELQMVANGKPNA
jgi:glycosyltransferase involved in cell wall biosynthesis